MHPTRPPPGCPAEIDPKHRRRRTRSMEEKTVAAPCPGAPVTCEILTRLPEDLLLASLARAGPVAACRAAAVCQAFHDAADTDALWASFLPRDLPPFADVELSPPPTSKKALFMRLSDGPVLLADGLTSMWLHRETGALCYMLSARKLNIALGDRSDSPAYCQWIPVTGSRFSEAAQLGNFRWLEIGCKIDSTMLSQHTTYIAYIVYKVEEDRGYGRYDNIFCDSESLGLNPKMPRPFMFPKKIEGGWMEVEIVEFHNDEDKDGEVSISLKKGPYRKTGLVVLGIEVRPKGVLSPSIACKRPAIWPAFRAPCHLPLLADGEVFEPLTSKKALFLRLLDGPVLLADGLTSLWLDKETGGVCYMLSARKLSIAWGDNPTYWHWIPNPITGFRFLEAAELQEAKWLEIRGNIDSKMLSQHTTYGAYIVYMLDIQYYGLRELKTSISIGGSIKSMGHVCLVDDCLPEYRSVMRECLPEDTHFPRDRGGGGMMEAELGEFCTGEGDDGEVSISLMHTFGSQCGLVVLGIETRPKKQGV